MTLETLMILACALLLVAAVAQWLALRAQPGRWNLVVVGTRLGAVVALVVALVWMVGSRGGWSPYDLQQVALSLALAAICVNLILIWRLGADGAGPVVGLVALALALFGGFAIQPGGPALNCAQRASPFWLQWILFVVGVGSILVAGSAGLMLAFHVFLEGRSSNWRLPDSVDVSACLRHATALGLIAIGSGLTMGVWWAWRTVGSLSSGDPREAWLVGAWLMAAMSYLSWQLDKRPMRWAASLSLGAALAAIFGVLVLLDVQKLLGL